MKLLFGEALLADDRHLTRLNAHGEPAQLGSSLIQQRHRDGIVRSDEARGAFPERKHFVGSIPASRHPAL